MVDGNAKEYIRKWDTPPTALQILEVLDHCAYGALASGAMMHVLHIMFDIALKQEETNREEVEKKAVWREAAPFKN